MLGFINCDQEQSDGIADPGIDTFISDVGLNLETKPVEYLQLFHIGIVLRMSYEIT